MESGSDVELSGRATVVIDEFQGLQLSPHIRLRECRQFEAKFELWTS